MSKTPKIPGSSAPANAAKSVAQRTAWSAIPPQFYIFMLIPTLGCVGAISYLVGSSIHGVGSRGGLYGVLIAGAVILVLLGIILLVGTIKKRRARKSAQSFEDNLKAEVAQHATPSSDPAEAARIDEIRQKFQRGIDTFRKYGKSVYDFPWYVIVGEPGAGKTEAIRHSSIHFPEGLQEKQQGVGGTYSMDWWFTDRAILLDTAGALLTEAQSAARFEEFLKMLSTHRPDCPINGMIIAISVESLLLDDVDEADRKGLNLAKQLSMIQKTLGIRFGVYVMLTKSDLITGFKEYCDAPVNAAYDRQMLGWSNPADLDAPINPAMVCEELEKIATQLRYRRWNIIQDPLAKERNGRRIDEVDALFAFPDALSQVVKRLGRYLGIVFSDSEWSEMPPFFRGVYFTSSKRQGTALDQQLAHALQLPPNRLPEGGIWEREKSMYLRDLFMDKIFREKGLVTRMRDIGALMRKRLTFYYILTASSLLALLGIGWLFYSGVSKRLAEEKTQLQAAHSGYTNGAFTPIVIRQGGEWMENPAHIELAKNVPSQKPPKGFGFFRPLDVFYTPSLKEERERARQVIIAGSLMKPLLDAAYEKMHSNADKHSSDAEMDATLAILRVKEAIANRTETMPDAVSNIVVPLLRYVAPNTPLEDSERDKRLNQFMDGFTWANETWMLDDAAIQRYSDGGAGSDLAKPSALHKGLSRFLSVHANDESQKQLVEKCTIEYNTIEETLFRAETLTYQQADATISRLETATKNLKDCLGVASSDVGHWGKVLEEMKTISGANGDRDSEFRTIAERLKQAGTPSKTAQDQVAKKEGDADAFLFEFRCKTYREMLNPPLPNTANLMGKMASKLEFPAAQAPEYQGDEKMKERFKRLCDQLAKLGLEKGQIKMTSFWRNEVKAALVDQSAYFPFVKLEKGAKYLNNALFEQHAKKWLVIKPDISVLEGLNQRVALPVDVVNAVNGAKKITEIVDLLWDETKKQENWIGVTFSGKKPEPPKPVEGPPEISETPEAPSPIPAPTPPSSLTSCTIYQDGAPFVQGAIGDNVQEKQMPISSGIVVGYDDAGQERKELRFDGPWGILRGLSGFRGASAMPSVEIVPDRLWIRFHFLKGNYNSSNWVTRSQLLDAFSERSNP